MRRTGIKRKTALAPGGQLGRKGSRPGRGAPIKPVNRKRKREAYARNFGPEADYVRGLPCIVAEKLGYSFWSERGCCSGSVVAAHVTARGMGAAKGCCMDIVPLCSAHHEEAGEARTSKRAAFEARYGLNLRKAADDFAVGHAPPLGIRGLALRWPNVEPLFKLADGTWRPYEDVVVAGGCEGCIMPLADHERDALMGWVRREMEREIERRCAGQISADEPSFAWDREALAHRIMQALGAPFTEDTHGEHGLAWTLCEAAGWPS